MSKFKIWWCVICGHEIMTSKDASGESCGVCGSSPAENGVPVMEPKE